LPLSHFGISSTALRSVLVERLGERPYQAFYSLLSFAAFAWLTVAYRHAESFPIWTTPDLVRLTTLPLVLLAFLLVVVGLTTSEPDNCWSGGALRSSEYRARDRTDHAEPIPMGYSAVGARSHRGHGRPGELPLLRQHRHPGAPRCKPARCEEGKTPWRALGAFRSSHVERTFPSNPRRTTAIGARGNRCMAYCPRRSSLRARPVRSLEPFR